MTDEGRITFCMVMVSIVAFIAWGENYTPELMYLLIITRLLKSEDSNLLDIGIQGRQAWNAKFHATLVYSILQSKSVCSHR